MNNKKSHPEQVKQSFQDRPALLTIVGYTLIVVALPVGFGVALGVILFIDSYWPDLVQGSGVVWIVLLTIASPILMGGIKLLNRRRQIRNISQSTTSSELARPPVLYLRAFSDDERLADPPDLANINPLITYTKEENLVEALSDIGPVIAIGRPGEPLPRLGAQRIYVNEDAWRVKVVQLMHEARLVVLMLGTGNGLWWEIEQALRTLAPDRLLFYGAIKDFPAFIDKAAAFFPRPVTLPRRKWLSMAPAEYLLFFDPRGNARFVRPPNSATLLRSNLRKPLLPAFQIAMRPLFEQLEIPWSPPPVPWRALVITISLLVLGFGTVFWLVLTQSE